MKLFEIPVYALTREKLKERVDNDFQDFKYRYPSNSTYTEEKLREFFDITAYPARLWDYNHIIGYMVISKQGYDYSIEWYAPLPSLQRYKWSSGKKHPVNNTMINGYHFYAGDVKTGEELRIRLNDLVSSFETNLKKRGYYADMEAFNSIDSLLDYNKLL